MSCPLRYVHRCLLFLLTTRLPPGSTLFPYTTLFRSLGELAHAGRERGQRLARLAHDRQERERREDPVPGGHVVGEQQVARLDRKSTRLNSSHTVISYAVFCLKKKTKQYKNTA